MVKAIRKKLHDSSAARWTVLVLVSLAMLAGYVLSDIMSPLDTMLNQQLGWTGDEYGDYVSGYAIFNVFILMLIFGGMILDRIGPRRTGVLAIFIMLGGTALKYWAIRHDFGGAVTSLTLFGWEAFTMKSQVFWAMVGFGIGGVGIELMGITANKVVVKWFKGHTMALAIGLNTAAGRIGTALALGMAVPVAQKWSLSAPLALTLMILCIGLLSFLVFCMVDSKADKESAEDAEEEEQFKFSDIFRIASIRGFWYIAILCALFYSAVFPFIKYATGLMIQKFHVQGNMAGLIVAMLPFGNMIMTPLFGSLYDYKGKGANLMLIGAVLLVIVHAVFSIPALSQAWVAVCLMIVLGAAFSLVPSAMWPSVPKIVPNKMLGTAYAMIFWLQNLIALWAVPKYMGKVLRKWCYLGQGTIDGQQTALYDYTLPMIIFMCFAALSIIFALLLRREDAKKGFGLQLPNVKKQA